MPLFGTLGGVLGPLTPSLTPEEIANAAILAKVPKAWWDFGALAGADGSNITSVLDLSGNGYTLTNPGTAPTIKDNGIGTRKVANFSASFADRRLQNSSVPAIGTGAFTLIFVHRLITLAANTHGEIQLGSSTNGAECLQLGLRNNTGCIITLTDRQDNLYVQDTPDRAVSTNYIDTIRRTNTATNRFRSNGVTKSPNFTMNSNIVGNRFCVGASSLEAVYALSYIGEIIWFDSALSDANVVIVENAINSKWGSLF